MKKEDIKTLTIVGSEVIINGVGNTINLSLADDIEAVQYHRGHRMLEEPLMKEVEFEKYQGFIDEWQKVEDMKEPEFVEEGLQEQRVALEESLKSQILALNPTVKFPTDTDANIDGVATIEELQAYLGYLNQKALIAKFEG